MVRDDEFIRSSGYLDGLSPQMAPAPTDGESAAFEGLEAAFSEQRILCLGLDSRKLRRGERMVSPSGVWAKPVEFPL